MKDITEATYSNILRFSAAILGVAAVIGLGGAVSISAKAEAEDASKGPIVMVSGNLSDPFFGAIKRGADDAARDLGVEYTYLAANITAVDLGKAIEAAIATNPAGLAFGDWFPETEDPLVLKLSQSGTPVVGYNASPENWRESTGALAWISQSDRAAGREAARRFAEAGAKHVLCINHAPGATILEQRCEGLAEGMKEAGGTSSMTSIPWSDSSNPGKVMHAIQGALNSDDQIDALFTLGSGVARDAVRAVEGSGKADQITIGTVDLSTAVLQHVQDGKVLFAIDQQPYLQGYYAIAALAQEIKYGLHLVGQISTGPLAITQGDAERGIEINSKEKGIRGAL